MRILILTQYYPPEHGAPQNRLHDLAMRLNNSGHEITVLTAMPNYPNGRIFPDYRGKFSMKEEIEGVKIIRSVIFASKKKSTVVQLMVYFSFVFSSLLIGLFKAPKTDLLICESPPLFLGFSALMLSFLKRAKLVMNISDLWPESAVQLGLLGPGLALSCLEYFEKLLYKRSKLVSCQTDGIIDGVLKRHPKASTFLLPNGVALEMFPVCDKDIQLATEFGLETDKFIVGYGGNHGRSQALGQILRAAEIIQNLGGANQVRFAIFGDGPEKEELIKSAGQKQLRHVLFFPSQPREKMAKIQALWDLALVPLKNVELFHGARPSKMFELMAGQIPFIFCGQGEGADLAAESGAALVVPSEDSQKLADAIIKLSIANPDDLIEMGRKGRAFVTTHFNRAIIAEKFESELQKVHTN